jgi:TolC family type I secretion outer membrane protein
MIRVLILLIAAGATAAAQQGATMPSLLTQDQAIALALEHHPSLREAGASLRVSEAVVRQARSAYFPLISASGSGSHIEGAFVFNPSIPARDQMYNSYSVGIQGQLTMFDFGKTANRVGAGDLGVEAAEFDVRAARDQVVTNVQIAYFGYMQARRVDRVNQEAVAQATEHLAQAKAFYSVGRRPQFDVTKAEVDLANANVVLIRGRNQLHLARIQLENAMGVHPPQEFTIEDQFVISPLTVSMDSVKAIAMERRPEILAGRARLGANEALVSAAWSQHLPTLSATGNYTWSGFSTPIVLLPQLFGRWTAGLSLTLPIFQGFSLDAQVEQAKANVDGAKASLDLLIENVLLEVEQNFFALGEASERIGAAAQLVEQAEQNLNLAQRQYAAGVGTPLDVADAQLSRSNALITQIQAQYDYNVALVRLRRAAGIMLL